MAAFLTDGFIAKFFKYLDCFASGNARQFGHRLDTYSMEAEFARAVVFENSFDFVFVFDHVNNFVDIFHSFVQGFSLRVAAGQGWAFDNKSAVFVFFHDYREKVFHEFSILLLGLLKKSF